jgi:hypothetical protein
VSQILEVRCLSKKKMLVFACQIIIRLTDSSPGPLADASDKLTATLSASSTAKATNTQTENWEIDSTVVTAPGQTQSVVILINTQTTTASFNYTYSFSGIVPVEFNNQINFGQCMPDSDKYQYVNYAPVGGYNGYPENWIYFIPVDELMALALQQTGGGGACQGFSVTGPDAASFSGSGIYSGSNGVNAVLVTTPISQIDCNSTQTSTRSRKLLRQL